MKSLRAGSALGCAALVMTMSSPLSDASVPDVHSFSSAAVSMSRELPAASAGTEQRTTRTRASWNPHVRCRATVTTLRHMIGKKRNRLGGATYRDGGFKPGIPDRRALHPPCHLNHGTTFVQMNRVTIGSCSKITDDGDWTCKMTDPSTPATRPHDMKVLNLETDQKFRARTGWSIPPGGVLVNIQGFVFWDPSHTSEAWHNHTGWELHSFTAWRRSAQKSMQPVSMGTVGCHMDVSASVM